MIETLLISLLQIGILTALALMSGGNFFGNLLNKKGEKDDTTGLDKGGIMPVNLSMMPEVLFGMSFAVTFLTKYFTYIFTFGLSFGTIAACALVVLAFLAVTAYTYACMETGHGVVLLWGRDMHELGYSQDKIDRILKDLKTRTHRIKPFVDWLADRLGIDHKKPDGTYTVNYCRLFMACKGFIIALPLFPFGLLNIILWPLAYEIGSRLNHHKTSEGLSGAFAGVITSIFRFLA